MHINNSMRQHNRLSVFLGLSLLTHTVFIVSTGFFSLNDKAELPIRVKLIEIPSPEKKEYFPVNSSSHSSIKHRKGITSQKINNKAVELSSESSNTIKKEEKIKKLEDTQPSLYMKTVKNNSTASIYTKPETTFEKEIRDAIPLDTKESKYSPYFDSIKRKIESMWRYPEGAISQGISGSTMVKFSILRDGSLLNIKLLKSTTHRILDEEVIRAVKTAAPFGSVPETIEGKQLNIVATFSYKPYFISQNKML